MRRRLTELDLTRIVKRVIRETEEQYLMEQVLDLTQNIKDLNLLFVKNMGSMQKNGTKYEGRYYFKAYESKTKPGVTVFTLNQVTKTGQEGSIWTVNTDAIIQKRLTKDYLWSTLYKALTVPREEITTDGKSGMITSFPTNLKQKVDEILTQMGAA